MNLDKELIETVLRNHGHSYTVQRVVSMEAESALPKGENYLSTIYRITLKVTLGNGRMAKKSLIFKVVPPEKAKTELVKNMGVFKSETVMYSTVLREMEMLMEEFGDTNDPLWCRLIHYEPYTSLLLEDLRTTGFRMTRRQDCLDLDHALLVLRSLGRFHAMSKILETRGIIAKEDYKPYSLVSDKKLIKYFMYYGLQTLAKAMEDHWGPEWYDVAQKLKIPCETLQEKMLELGKVDETRFNCLNHGDCWSNNMMFKYDWQNRPYTMRFIDWQVCHYSRPAFDVTYLMYASVLPSVRRSYYDLLINAYVDSVHRTLNAFGHRGSALRRVTVEEMRAEMDRIFLLRVFCLVIINAATTNESGEVFDMEMALETQGTDGIDPSMYCGIYQDRVGADWADLAERIVVLFKKQ